MTTRWRRAFFDDFMSTMNRVDSPAPRPLPPTGLFISEKEIKKDRKKSRKLQQSLNFANVNTVSRYIIYTCYVIQGRGKHKLQRTHRSR